VALAKLRVPVALAVPRRSAEVLTQKIVLPLAPVGQIRRKDRSQNRVRFDTAVERLDQRPDPFISHGSVHLPSPGDLFERKRPGAAGRARG
jgi:hypothetical protein